MKLQFKIVLSVFLLVWVQCAQAANNEAVGNALSELFESGEATTGSDYSDSQFAEIKFYYSKRNFKPIWVRDNGPKGKAKALVAELRISAVHGLSPSFYNIKKINSLMSEKSAKRLAMLELLLSGSFVEFGRDLRNGRIGPSSQNSMNAIVSKPVRPDEYIRGAESAGNLRVYMGGLLQSDKRYVRLIAKLTEFLRINASGRWPLITSDIAPVHAGQSSKEMNLFRNLLVLTGDLPFSAAARGLIHDQTTIKAVKYYQLRHGLQQTGNIDRATLQAMEVPIKTRIKQIRVNLERRRWQVHAIGSNHIYVNLANQSLRIVRSGKTVAVHKLLDISELATVPAFVGAIKFDEQQSFQEIRVSSDFISKFSPTKIPQSIGVIGYRDFARSIKLFTAHAKEKNINATSLPLFVTYVTAWATKDGKIHFRKDIFGKDHTMAILLDLNN